MCSQADKAVGDLGLRLGELTEFPLPEISDILAFLLSAPSFKS